MFITSLLCSISLTATLFSIFSSHYRYGFAMLDMVPPRSTRVSAERRSSNDNEKRVSKQAPWSTNYPNDSGTSPDFGRKRTSDAIADRSTRLR